MNKTYIVPAIFLTSITLLAQPPAPTHDREMDEFGGKKMEMMMIWRLTDDLELTEKQAEIFFPKFRIHQEKMEKLREEGKKSMQKIRDKIRDENDISENDLDDALKTFKELEEKKAETRVEFVKSLKGTMSTEQQAKLLLVPHKMRKDAKQKIKKHKKFRTRRNRTNRWR